MKTITVDDSFQKYSYKISEPAGKHFAEEFKPQLMPQEMLELGVFGGHYFQNEQDEFPSAWFKKAKLSDRHNSKLNFFGVNASQPLQEWQRKGWIYQEDPRGWFQWYCRYYIGRRIADEDRRQIKRWVNMRRHVSQVKNACQPGDWSCHTRQRQALLHWAYDSRKL